MIAIKSVKLDGVPAFFELETLKNLITSNGLACPVKAVRLPIKAPVEPVSYSWIVDFSTTEECGHAIAVLNQLVPDPEHRDRSMRALPAAPRGALTTANGHEIIMVRNVSPLASTDNVLKQCHGLANAVRCATGRDTAAATVVAAVVVGKPEDKLVNKTQIWFVDGTPSTLVHMRTMTPPVLKGSVIFTKVPFKQLTDDEQTARCFNAFNKIHAELVKSVSVDEANSLGNSIIEELSELPPHSMDEIVNSLTEEKAKELAAKFQTAQKEE